MNDKQKRWLLIGLAVITLALVWFAPQEDAVEVSAPADRPLARVAPSVAVPASRVALAAPQAVELARNPRPPASSAPDLFKASSWFIPPPPPPPPPPAPPPPPPPPPPAPTAPALPFAFMGHIVEGDKVQVLLTRGDRVVTAYVGETIDKTYRVESFKAGFVTFVYLPLNTRQTLATGLTP